MSKLRLDGTNVSAHVSNVDGHFVHVDFYTAYDNTIVHSVSVITKNGRKYSAMAVTGQNSNLQKKNGAIWDPGGTYYYYVTNSFGSGSHTWTYWHTPGSSWTSSSDAYPQFGIFFITWNGPGLILFLGIPEIFVNFTRHASNSVSWSHTSDPFGPRSGSSAVTGYQGIFTTMSVTASWSYLAVGGF